MKNKCVFFLKWNRFPDFVGCRTTLSVTFCPPTPCVCVGCAFPGLPQSISFCFFSARKRPREFGVNEGGGGGSVLPPSHPECGTPDPGRTLYMKDFWSFFSFFFQVIAFFVCVDNSELRAVMQSCEYFHNCEHCHKGFTKTMASRPFLT